MKVGSAIAQLVYVLGSGQEVYFGPSRPDPGRNARSQDGTRTGRDGRGGTWTGPDPSQARVWMAPTETVTDV